MFLSLPCRVTGSYSPGVEMYPVSRSGFPPPTVSPSNTTPVYVHTKWMQLWTLYSWKNQFPATAATKDHIPTKLENLFNHSLQDCLIIKLSLLLILLSVTSSHSGSLAIVSNLSFIEFACELEIGRKRGCGPLATTFSYSRDYLLIEEDGPPPGRLVVNLESSLLEHF